MPHPTATGALRRTATGVSLLLALAASPAGAAPVPCGTSSGDTVCDLVTTNASVRIRIIPPGDLQVDTWEVGGVSQLFAQGFVVYDFVGGDFPDFVLQSATVDAATNTVATDFRDVSNAVDIMAAFTLSENGGASILDEDFTIKALVNGISGRVYSVNDFDLAGGAGDGSIVATSGGSVITQSDGGTQVTTSVTAGSGPDAFQVATCCTLDQIFSDVFVALDGTAALTGPADFESAQSWDRSLSKNQTFSVSLRHEITVPEAGAGGAGGVAGLALAGLAARRRRPVAPTGARPGPAR